MGKNGNIEKYCSKHGFYVTGFCRGDFLLGARTYINHECPQCAFEARFQRLFGRTAVPPRFAEKNFGNYEPKTDHQKVVFNALKEYGENIAEVVKLGRSLMLTGNAGTGKTHLACSIIAEAIKQGYSALFTESSAFVRSIKDGWSERASEQEILDRYVNIDLLVIDEIGIGFKGDQNLLFTLINERYKRVKPTILLSNLKPAELLEFLGERIVDRLRENGGKMYVFDWGSHRA